MRKRRIPFEIEMTENDAIHEEGRRAFMEIRNMAEQGAFPDMTLDEINEEIRLAREGKWCVTPAEMMEIVDRNK